MPIVDQHSLRATLLCLGWWGASAHAAPPLLTAAEVVGVDLEVYVRSGAVTLTQPGTDGTRIALRPLVSDAPGPLPPDLPSWTRLQPGACTEPPTFRWKRGEHQAIARTTGTWEQPVVEVQVDATTVAIGAVGRPAQICALHVQNVDDIPGEEVIVLWQTGRPDDPRGPNTPGVSILRIPETAQ